MTNNAPPAAQWFADALNSPIGLDHDWVLWRAFCLRGTGFPLATLDPLVNPELEAPLAALFAAEQHLEALVGKARTRVRTELPQDTPAAKKSRQQALTQLARGRVPEQLDALAEGAALAADIRAAVAAQEQCLAAVEAAVLAADDAGHSAMREAARSPRLREAIAWQNRSFHNVGLSAYIDSHDTGHKARRRRRNIVKYLQRYATKNESIGFFGPFGWGSFAAAPARLTAATEFLAARFVYYEYWALDALVRRLCQDPDFMLTVAPRLSPRVRLEGNELHSPFGSVTLTPVQSRFLAACDGSTSAASLCAGALDAPDSGLHSEAEFVSLLEQLVDAEMVHWTPPVPVELAPEKSLRRALEQIPDADVRARIAAPFERVETARQNIRTATDSMARIKALEQFDAAFEAATGVASTRNAGVSYAGRAPLFEDTVRSLELALPERVVTELAPALTLLMMSARWFGAQLTRQFGDLVRGHFGGLSARLPRVGLADLWSSLEHDTVVLRALVDDVTEQLQERWAAVLELEARTTDPKPINLDTAAIAARVRDQFDEPAPGWPGARFNSPDLMLAASDVTAFDGDDWFAVLGEIHPLLNILTQEVTCSTSPVPELLLARAERERPERELVPVKARGGRGHRTSYGAAQANDVDILYDDSASLKSAAQTRRIADFECVEAGGELRLRSLVDDAEFDAIDFLAPQIRALAASKFKPFAAHPHLPRITLDRLVFHRESWTVPLAQLPFATGKKRHRRYLDARRWARELALPRYCFYRLPGSAKPWFLDFHSLLLVDLFTEQVQQVTRENPDNPTLKIAEMLPDPSQCWLADAAGDRYTSELRMAVRDGGTGFGADG